MGDDLVTCVIDEICLEGLDGITLEDLWLRLKERPGFDLILDDSAKEFLWKIIKELEDVEFYELPEPRNPLVIFDRYKYIDPELGTVLEPDVIPEDIYPFHPIDDTKNGVMGSCSTYHKRCQLKEEIASMSYTDIISRYGRKFVVVGNQLARNVALMGEETDPGVELSLMHYCLLERIGRSRYHGEITQGKISLQVVGEDPKSLFYHRKFLAANKFISKQVHHLKTAGAQNCSGSLLHLPRFYVERKPKALYLTEKVIEILKSRPNYIAEYDEIRQELRLANSLKKLFKTFDFQRYVKTDMRIPYRALHPDAKPSEWKLKANDKEKSIRVIQLIDPDMNVQDLWIKDDEYEEAEDGNTEAAGSVEQVLDRPLLTQAYYAVEAAGPQGVSQLELASIMSISKLQSRTICRNLLRTGLIVTFMNDIGRQRVSRFMAKKFEAQCEMNVQFNRERQRMLALTTESSYNSNAAAPSKIDTITKRKSNSFGIPSQSKKQKVSNAKKKPKQDNVISNTDGNRQISMDRNIEVPLADLKAATSVECDIQTPGNESLSSLSSEIPLKIQETSFHPVNSSSFVNISEQNTSLPLPPSSLPPSQEVTLYSEKLDNVHEVTKATQNVISGHTLPHTSTSSPAPESSSCTGQTFPYETSVSFLSSTPLPSKQDRPVVTMKTVSDNGIVTEITESTAVRQVPSGLAEDLKSYFAHQVKDTTCVTYRLLRRANLIMECIKSQKVIEDLTKLMKLISEEEDQEGYNVRIDKKSLMRLLSKLSNDGFLKVIKVVLKGEDKEKVLHFVCEPSVTVDHSVIQSAIEQARVKFLISAREKVPKPPPKPETTKENKEDICKECPTVNQSVHELNSINVGIKGQKLIYDKRIGKKYGFSPKFIRMKTLHQFLFYLIVGYEGDLDLDQEKALIDLKEQGAVLTEEDELNMPKIYVPKLSWKMFIPPLPEHTGWPKGWALMCDILLRLPLSIFVKVFNVSYVVPEMESYLTHPLRRHYLVKHLPESMRFCLIARRKYIFSIHEVMQRLCFIGLLRFGPQRLKEKDQVFVYLNRRTHLLDTTTSKPGYHQISDNIVYEEHKYYFSDMADVDKYWYDLWNICLHTNLGGRLCVEGKDIVLEVLHNKPAMLKSLEPVTPQDIDLIDVGEVPGDKRGAGGLDSALFSHLKRNWNWSFTSKTASFDTGTMVGTMPQVNEVNKQNSTPLSDDIKKNKQVFDSYAGNLKKANRLQSSISRKPNVAVTAASPLKPTPAPKNKPKAKKITRKVLIHQKKRGHRPYYDEADQAALLLMSKLRVDWSHTEDNFLLLCKVASMYLCPIPRQQLVPLWLIRDILHSKFPESHNKTSRACQRRITYMMKNMSTSSSVALYLEEIRQDPEIKKNFEISVSELRKTCENAEEVEKIVADKFRVLVDVLEKRFDKLANKKASMVIPDTPELFWQKYEIIRPSKSLKKRGFFQDVKCIQDIQKAVIQSVIHSSLCSVQDKTSWAYQLFKVYQQFPDNLLRCAMKKVREDQMVSLKKNYTHLAQRKGNFLPLSCSPFQLSISYRHILQTSYQYSIFHQSFIMSSNIDNWHTSNDMEKERGLQLMITDGGSTAALVELFCKGVIEFDFEIPDQIITLNPKVSEVDESYARIIERYREILRSYKPGTEFFSSSALFKNYGSSTGANSDESDEEEDKDDPDYTPADDGSVCNATSLARTASRIALYMMREELEDKMVENNQHAHDFFVVNSCTLYCKIDKSSFVKTNQEFKDYIRKKVYPLEKEQIKSTLDDLSSRICVKVDKIDEEDLRTSFISSGHSESDWAKMLKIISYLAYKKELGARLKQFEIVCKRYFKELPFSEIVSFLTQNGVAIRTGVTEIRYIHWKFAGPWLVNTRRLCRLNREKIKPIVAKGLRVGGNEEEVITEGERERVIKKKKKQILLQLKRRKAVRKALRQKQQQKLRKVKSQTGKTKSSVIKRNRYRFSLKVKSHLRSELKAHAKSNSSGVNVNPDSQQVTVVPENTERNSISDYNQENGSTTDNTDKNIPNTDKNIPLSEGISSYDHPEQTVGVKSAKTGQDSVETCMSDKPNDVNAFESAQESVEAQITDDTLKFTSVVTTPNIAEDVESATVSETVGTTPANIIPSSDLDCCGSSNSKQHIPESTVVAEKSKTSEIPNKKAKEVKQENVEVQRPRKRRRDQITRKEKIEMDKTAKVMELKAAARELENSQQIQVSMRPWIRINGTLNRRILDRLLGAILGHCMAKPGNTIESIGERFTPAIQPFHVRELVEILWKLGCVKLFTIRKSWPATLFSPPSNIAILPADGSESSADIMVDPQPDAITRLGQFIGNKTYKKDFISC